MGPKAQKQFRHGRKKRSEEEAAEIKSLEAKISEGAPAPVGVAVQDPAQDTSYASAKKFRELPLSEKTQKGLKEAKFKSLTAIQRHALPQAICGRDVLGAAKTGSGKTLAFLIPVLEKLYRVQWGSLDGLGALVISPTRELALQIFNEFKKVGRHHEFSAGLLIGGKNVKDEKDRVGGLNILICTPGRLLQHMDESPGFDASYVQILVLDEADRILDLGFSAAVNAIVQNLPKDRQTLLFSATQKQAVKQLARLSLKDPQYVSVHENAEAPTPVKLEQAYAIVELHEKLNVLWSFIRTHLKAKILVFASTCKQVKFMFEAFSRLRPGCPLRSLHGGMKQMKRLAVFYDFAEAKSGMVLFATDVAARGLDFAKLDWVVQLDCPEDVPAYIHRVGRTARYVSAGRGLLLLAPSEEAFLTQLEQNKVPIKRTKINPGRTQPITPALQALLSKILELKESAQRSITAYLRSVFLAPNKAVFDVNKLPIEEFALSLGLSAPPQLRFIKKSKAGKKPDPSAQAAGALLAEPSQSPEGSSEDEGIPADPPVPSKAAPLLPDEDELLHVKSKDDAREDEAEGLEEPQEATLQTDSKKKKKKLRIKPNAVNGNRMVFDDEGAPLDPLAALADDSAGDAEESLGHKSAADRFATAAAILKQRDVEDKKAYQEKRRNKAAERKAKRKAAERGDETAQVTLGPGLGYPGEEHDDEMGEKDGELSDGMDWDSEDSAVLRDLKRARREASNGGNDKKSRTERSHLGMALTDDVDDMSLADQEALAMKLLSMSRQAQ